MASTSHFPDGHTDTIVDAVFQSGNVAVYPFHDITLT